MGINSLAGLERILETDKKDILRALRWAKNGYKEIMIKKKDLSPRILSIPKDFLKDIQNRIYYKILQKILLPPCVHGGVKKRSIITNARCHTGKEYVVNLDIDNFFDNVHYSRILEVFKGLHCNEKISKVLTRLVTHNYCLPQGAPTSPYLSNLVLFNLDKRFVMFCRLKGMMYTRYFDDITISGGKCVNDEKIKLEYWDIIESEGYKVNYKKTKFYHKSEEQLVNGIIVNKGLRPTDKFVENLEKYVNGLYKFGLSILTEECFFKEKDSIMGKIKFLNILDKAKAVELKRKLDLVKWGF